MPLHVTGLMTLTQCTEMTKNNIGFFLRHFLSEVALWKQGIPNFWLLLRYLWSTDLF